MVSFTSWLLSLFESMRRSFANLISPFINCVNLFQVPAISKISLHQG